MEKKKKVMPVIQKTLVKKTAESTGIPPEVVEMVIATFLHHTRESLIQGKMVTWNNFGKFGFSNIVARMMKNLQGGIRYVPPKRIVKFWGCGTLRSGVQRVKEEEDRQKDIDKLSTNVSGNDTLK